jgi:anti-sigma factor RsiW
MSACREWKDDILQFVLGNGANGSERSEEARRLESHLKGCAECTSFFAEVRTRTIRVDAALPKLADAPEMSEGFEARVFARIANEKTTSRKTWWSGWGMRVATAGVVCALVVGAVTWPQMKKIWESRPLTEVSITTWQSPTESLLRTPGQELLEHGPKVGDVYFPVNTGRERVNK